MTVNVTTPCITLCIRLQHLRITGQDRQHRQSELAPAVQGSAWSLLAPHSCTAAHQLNRQLRVAISLAVARHAARDVQVLQYRKWELGPHSKNPFRQDSGLDSK